MQVQQQEQQQEQERCILMRRRSMTYLTLPVAPVLIADLAREIGLPTEVVEEMYEARMDVASLVPRVTRTALKEESEKTLSEPLQEESEETLSEHLAS